ncbi:MAG TPA: redoxin family protein [Acidisarcina sp.]
MKRLENISNVAVIVAVLVFLGAMARNEFGTHKQPDMSAGALIGKTVALPGVRFPEKTKSLVLAISTTCHYCKESEPFYRDLLARSAGKVKVVAVLPQSQAEAQAFVKDEEMPSMQVVSAQLDSIGVHATPTLLLVDERGRVQNAWIGKLDEKGQQDVLSRAAL